MGIHGASNSSAKIDLKEISKNIGTGPTEIEKKIVKSFNEGAKEVSKTVSSYVKTPEGKVTAAGLLLSPVVLPVGMGLIFGATAYSALKHLTENKEDHKVEGKIKEAAKAGAKIGAAGAAIGVATAIAGPAGVVAAAAIAVAKAAEQKK